MYTIILNYKKNLCGFKKRVVRLDNPSGILLPSFHE
jgi:hypothetical protein